MMTNKNFRRVYLIKRLVTILVIHGAFLKIEWKIFQSGKLKKKESYFVENVLIKYRRLAMSTFARENRIVNQKVSN